MCNRKVLSIVLILLTFLMSCSKADLITESHAEMTIHLNDELVYTSTDESEIRNVIEKINTERRSQTTDWDYDEPEGTLTLKGKKHGRIIPIDLSGNVYIDDYIVYTNFTFFDNNNS